MADGWTIVSGGQTGVDRAALDAARALGLGRGGFVPKGRWTEAGPLPEGYEGMVETASADPAERTRRNVALADATLVLARTGAVAAGGTALALREARESGKPLLRVDPAAPAAARAVRAWLAAMPAGRLNVAGPRASEDPAIYEEARALLLRALAPAGRSRP